MKITNTTRSDIGLQPGMIVPAMGNAEIDGDAYAKIKGLPSVQDHFDKGRLAHTGGTVSKASPEREKLALGREDTIKAIIKGLPDTEYTKGGKPEVDAINAAMVKGAEPVTAAERDAVWEGMSA